jgi:hypothetical protein
MAPDQSLDIEPAADRNLVRMSDCCLDVQPKSAYILGKGRGGGAWWMIWMFFFVFVLCCCGLLFLIYTTHFDLESAVLRKGVFEAVFFVIIPSAFFFGLSLLWPIHVWKTHLPLRFNRQTRKIYFHWKGKTHVEKWDDVNAQLKVQFGVNAMGAPFQDPQINIEFHKEDGSPFSVLLMGVEDIDLSKEQQAAVFWEYIRRYMEEGPEHLPMPDTSHEFGDNPLQELRQQYRLFPLWKGEISLLSKIFNIVLIFPFSIVWVAITYPTEILYYYLQNHIKTNPFPPEMEEACRCNEAEKIWYPKHPAEK